MTTTERQFDSIKKMMNSFLCRTTLFHSPVIVNPTPHTIIFSCYGIIVSDTQRVFLMDFPGKWHELEVKDENSEMVIQSIYQRLKLMSLEGAPN